MVDFYDLGYQAGAADMEPVPLTGDVPITPENMKEYLAGWVLGQAWMRRAKDLGWSLDDQGFGPPPYSIGAAL
jgi:hypothetical protein